MATSILECIQSVCAESATLTQHLIAAQGDVRVFVTAIENDAEALSDFMAINGDAVRCVVNGSEWQSCQLRQGAALTTMAEVMAAAGCGAGMLPLRMRTIWELSLTQLKFPALIMLRAA